MRQSSSKAWMKRHVNDKYVKEAKSSNYRSRSAFKLLEIQEKHKIFRLGDNVFDLGAAPGGWSIVAHESIHKKRGKHSQNKRQPPAGGRYGLVVGIDLLPIQPTRGVHFIQGDIRDPEVQRHAQEMLLPSEKAHIVISDMAPNLSGHRDMDHFRSIQLCTDALDFAIEVLKPGGTFLCKFFKGRDEGELRAALRRRFTDVALLKPRASRKESSEAYFLARRFLPPPSSAAAAAAAQGAGAPAPSPGKADHGG